MSAEPTPSGTPRHCPKCGWRLSEAKVLPEGWYCPNPNCLVGPTTGVPSSASEPSAARTCVQTVIVGGVHRVSVPCGNPLPCPKHDAPSAARTETPRMCKAATLGGDGAMHRCGYRMDAHNKYQHESVTGYIWPIEEPDAPTPSAPTCNDGRGGCTELRAFGSCDHAPSAPTETRALDDEPLCRDCADEDGTCPATGLPCGGETPAASGTVRMDEVLHQTRAVALPAAALPGAPEGDDDLHEHAVSRADATRFVNGVAAHYQERYAALAARLAESERQREALTLADMQAINAARSARWMAGSPGWTTLEIAGELAGEVGELANVCKKLRRSELGVPGNKLSDDELRSQARSEMADVLIVLMLTASKLGVDLYDAVCETFNAKSEQMGFPERFAARTPEPRPTMDGAQ